MTDKNDPKWCSLPWHHLMINPGGWVRPCCRFLLEELPSPAMHIGDDLSAVFAGDYMSRLRTDLIEKGSHPGCRKCYEEEDAKKALSHRQRSNQDRSTHDPINLDQPKLTFLEVSFSNICNLACRMCHPEYSTRWHKDYYQLVGEEYKSAYSYRFQIDHFRKILGDLKYIKFTGGEPLLIKEYEEILDAVIEVGNAKNIFLNYSTNLTIAPSPSLVDKWKKFKGIVFALSLDGVGPVIEYVRHPTKWKTVEQVIPILFSLSHQLPAVYSFRASVMPYNVLNIPETLLWWQGQAERHMKAPSKETNIINPTHIHYPEFLTLRVLPAEVKDFVSRKLLSVDIGPRENQAIRHLVNYMNGQDDSHLFPQFMSYTMALDELHGQSFLDVCPDIAGPILSLWQDRKLPAPADFIFRSVADASGE